MQRMGHDLCNIKGEVSEREREKSERVGGTVREDKKKTQQKNKIKIRISLISFLGTPAVPASAFSSIF